MVAPVNADVNDFYFSDFTGDYYLGRDEAGVSYLKVKESVTAEFPEFNQNKGICRQIPFTNRNGKNITLPKLTRDNLSLTRNGVPEPIYSIDKEKNFYNVCTGTDEYVLGSQTYVFEYEYKKVITSFRNGDKEWQELYWDTNGNGSLQRFDKVTARLHFENPDIWTGESWCYVGRVRDNGQDRCMITKISDGVEFAASNLARFENLTFDVELKPDSFTIPELEDNYTLVWLTVIVGVLYAVWVLVYLVKYLKVREKEKHYKGLFVAPQYQPHQDYSLPEMAEIYLEKKKDSKVAMLLEMVVQKRIALKKEDGKENEWGILVGNLDGVGEEYIDLLTILNDGVRPREGDEIKVERHKASNELITLKNNMEGKILKNLKSDKLVEKKYQIGGSVKKGIISTLVSSFLIDLVVIMVGIVLLGLVWEWAELEYVPTENLVFYDEFYPVLLTMTIVISFVAVALNNLAKRYIGHTKKGLEMSRYMDGLKLYIKMAEAERIKFLQGVKTVDISATGIVKLYEKLLPYAAVFGLEESWMTEMKKYCEVEEIEEPDYLLNSIAAYEISRMMHDAATFASAATVMTSSGGGSSSDFSGGGGGGFSGGGGGGGGFSGR